MEEAKDVAVVSTDSKAGRIDSVINSKSGVVVVGNELWEEIKGLKEGGKSISEIARTLEMDRKTVRRCLRQGEWKPYRRAVRSDTLLSEHAAFIGHRAAEVDYSARILYQELKLQRNFAGSYETVKRAVAPLRSQREASEVCQTRFETEPGHQAQIDWGEVKTYFRSTPVKLHLFVLTLGYSRRAYYTAYANEQLGTFMEAHEQAFEHFGGLCREHLYDRPRTVCQPQEGKKGYRWNATFKKFAEHWGYEPRLCRAYRAQTKGKVESGVKYVKGNFMPGRKFIDIEEVHAQLAEWTRTVADVRIHGTVHQRPIDRFATEQRALMPITVRRQRKLTP